MRFEKHKGKRPMNNDAKYDGSHDECSLSLNTIHTHTHTHTRNKSPWLGSLFVQEQRSLSIVAFILFVLLSSSLRYRLRRRYDVSLLGTIWNPSGHSRRNVRTCAVAMISHWRLMLSSPDDKGDQSPWCVGYHRHGGLSL